MTEYRCSQCGAEGIKLWRPAQNEGPLLCAACACAYQGVLNDVDDQGRRSSKHGGRTDQIGDLLPAVPAPGDTFWGYTSVPKEAVAWWKAMSTQKNENPPR